MSRRLLSSLLGASLLAPVAQDEPPDIRLFFAAASLDESESERALAALAESWRDEYAAMVVDVARFMRPPRNRRGEADFGDLVGDDTEPEGEELAEVGAAGGGRFPTPGRAGPAPEEHPSTRVRERLLKFLEARTGQRLGQDLRAWRRWYWSRPYSPHPDYALFKAVLYGQVDERMVAFFPVDGPARIRLDEVDWGGVVVNGIPPLDRPRVVPAAEARYLEDSNVVFGVAIEGEYRAYPQRILGWHELALDKVGGVDLAVVYCTLCGTVIPYASEVSGRRFTFGTSGLLYRSNKLMFDAETKSLWSTAAGRPVIGTLADTDLELRAYPVVTTTWGEWRRLHPESTVLSLETGHQRDYSEGAAYRDYFRTHNLMFAVPDADERLRNKDEVLALVLPDPDGEGARALAISAELLARKQNRVFHARLGGRELVVITSREGANRVYDAGSVRFGRVADDGTLIDQAGASWTLTEDALVPSAGGDSRPRVPARRAFWFGWRAQYPDTQLIH